MTVYTIILTDHSHQTRTLDVSLDDLRDNYMPARNTGSARQRRGFGERAVWSGAQATIGPKGMFRIIDKKEG